MNRDIGILILRISMGSAMIGHGLMKIGGGTDFLRSLGGMPGIFPENPTLHLILGSLAAAFEILGGLGVAVGYRFRAACTLIILVMIPAFIYHLPNITGFRALMTNTWPLEVMFVFLALLFIGPGEKILKLRR